LDCIKWGVQADFAGQSKGDRRFRAIRQFPLYGTGPPGTMPRMSHPSEDDRELVSRARAGDFTAFEALVALYARRIYSLAMRIVGQREDAEEVVQQTFLSVIEHLAEFREESQFSTWLMRIAMNHALGLLRKRRRQRTMPLAEVESEENGYDSIPRPEFIAQWRETPEQIASRHETQRLLQEALNELVEKYRVVFVLRDIQGLSTHDTARELGISEANVKVRLLRARLMLRERLTRTFGDEAAQVQPHDHA
jgi:RNA polymerase sigma-70 factor, ECF subfamily